MKPSRRQLWEMVAVIGIIMAVAFSITDYPMIGMAVLVVLAAYSLLEYKRAVADSNGGDSA